MWIVTCRAYQYRGLSDQAAVDAYWRMIADNEKEVEIDFE